VRLLIVGAGGHAKVVLEAAESAGWEIAAVVGLETDDSELLGHAVTLSADGIDADGFIVAIGSNPIRARYFEQYRDSGLTPVTVIHPSAVLSPTAKVGAGAFVAAGCIVNAMASIGPDAILNTGCVVEHDVVVGGHSLVGPLASLCGGAAIDQGVLLGAGATVAPGRRIGAWSVCGAGAVIVDDLPSGMICAGVPARPVRAVEGD